MFKLARKTAANQNKQVLKQGVTGQTPARQITSNTFMTNIDIDAVRRRDALDVYGKIMGNTGVVRMNKEHKYNLLTPHFITEWHRGIESFNIDPIVYVIYLSTHKGQHFCGGTDFRTIEHMKKEGNFDKIMEYLEQVYSLQTYVAKCNKPVVAIAPGNSYNSGATMLTAMGYPMGTLNSSIAFNEATFGFVPHAGASYYLTRLPGEMGTFLALTGMKLTSSDAARMGILEGVVHDTKDYHYTVAGIVDAQEYPRYKGSQIHKTRHDEVGKMGSQWELDHEFIHNTKMEHVDFNKQRMLNKLKSNHYREEFLEAKDRIPDATAEAEYRYMHHIQENYEKNGFEKYDGYLNSFSMEGDRSQYFKYINYYKETVGYLKAMIGNQYRQDQGEAMNHQQMIDRCFYHSSVEEIKDALRKENHPFATQCLKAIEANSPLSTELSLQMLRKARNMDYKSCMRMELDVAANVIKDKEFSRGISEVIRKPNRTGTPFYEVKWGKLPKQHELQRFFEPSAHSQSVNLDVVENALLPNRMHYERFSDQVRIWINEESTHQDEIRDFFDEEAKEALREHGIDIRDKSMTIENARDHLAGKLARERYESVMNERMEQLMTDQKLRDDYFAKIDKQVKKLGNNKTFYKKVNKYVDEIFLDAYQENLSKMYNKSKEAQSLEKRRMLVRLKKFLFKNRIMTYSNREWNQQHAQLQNMPFKQIHLTENWDESYIDQANPMIEKSPVWHVMKAVGRVSMTTPEMIKTFLTDPDQRQAMSMLSLNKKELKKLSNDVHQDPAKYLEMFTKKERRVWDESVHRWREETELRYEKADYWYRVLNDGRSPMDEWPLLQEFLNYQDWAEGVEAKAVDTLKYITAQLLAEYKEDKRKCINGKEGNYVFENKAGESRYEAIERLHTLLSEKSPDEVTPIVEKPRQERALGGERTIDELDTMLRDTFENDFALKHLFVKKQGDNALINDFREEVYNQLLALLEVSLLGSKSQILGNADKKALAERLQTITTPRGYDSQRHNQLRVIDAYLSQTNSRALIEEAMQVIRPFFMQSFSQRLEQEASEILSELKASDTNMHVLLHYFMHMKYPDFTKNSVYEKLMNHSELRLRRGIFEAANPEISQTHIYKSLLNALGELPADITKESFAVQQQAMMRRVIEDKQQMEGFQRHLDKWDEKFAAEADRYRQSWQKDLEKLDDQDWSDYEEQQLRAWEFRILDMFNYLQEHRYEIENNFNVFDWLKIYSHALNEQNLDMEAVIKEVQYETKDEVEPLAQMTRQYSADEWKAFGEYAQWLYDFNAGLHDHQDSVTIDLTKFMGVNESDNSPAHHSIVQKALEARHIFQEAKQAESKLDRFAHIRGSIDDYNSIQQLKQKQLQLKSDIKAIATTQAQADFVKNAFQSKYVNLEALRDALNKGATPESLSDFIDTEKLITDYKQGRALGDFSDELQNTRLDVVSLAEARHLADEGDLSDDKKAQFKSLIDHVDSQTRFISNKERSQISLSDFLDRHHYTSTNAYSNYTSDLLKKKLESELGDFPTSEQIDWDFAGNRTNPGDHYKTVSEKELNKYIDDVANDRVKSTDRQVQFENEIGETETMNDRKYEQTMLLRDAKDLAKMPADLESVRNLHENQLLKLITQVDFEDKEMTKLIESYMNIRLRTALLNQDFANKVKKSANGHYYLKVLKETVLGELNLDDLTHAEKFSYANMDRPGATQLEYDIESPYNLQHINNLDALGFDNLYGRASADGSSPAAKADAAQQNVFEKLLADYFLSKRGDYVETNKLVKDLTDIFNKEAEHPLNRDRSLSHRLLESEVMKQDEPVIDATRFRDMMNLDAFTNRALQKNKNGLSDDLRKLSIKDTDHPEYYTTQIPDYYDLYDVRKPPAQYVEDKLKQVIQEMFESRRKLEKGMTRRELLAFDQTLASFLQKDKLMPRLKKSIELDYNNLHHGKALTESAADRHYDTEVQYMKEPNTQRENNSRVKDEDALFKLLAYNAMIEQKHKDIYENKEANYRDVMWNTTTFEEYYKTELKRKSKTDPIPVNPEAFAATKAWERTPADAEYKTRFDREQEFYEDHKFYLENKKEQQDRIQLFYILEQFFEHSRENPDPMSKAQDNMKEYFSDPDNTFFFDKNKI